MPYGKKVTFTLDEQEVKDIIHLIKKQDLTDETNKLLYEPILIALEKIVSPPFYATEKHCFEINLDAKINDSDYDHNEMSEWDRAAKMIDHIHEKYPHRVEKLVANMKELRKFNESNGVPSKDDHKTYLEEKS